MSLEHAPQRQKQNSAIYLTAPQLRARYGGISDMTLWRWLADPSLGFPQPMVVNRRRLFDLHQLEEFDRRQVQKTREAA